MFWLAESRLITESSNISIMMKMLIFSLLHFPLPPRRLKFIPLKENRALKSPYIPMKKFLESRVNIYLGEKMRRSLHMMACASRCVYICQPKHLASLDLILLFITSTVDLRDKSARTLLGSPCH